MCIRPKVMKDLCKMCLDNITVKVVKKEKYCDIIMICDGSVDVLR